MFMTYTHESRRGAIICQASQDIWSIVYVYIMVLLIGMHPREVCEPFHTHRKRLSTIAHRFSNQLLEVDTCHGTNAPSYELYPSKVCDSSDSHWGKNLTWIAWHIFHGKRHTRLKIFLWRKIPSSLRVIWNIINAYAWTRSLRGFQKWNVISFRHPYIFVRGQTHKVFVLYSFSPSTYGIRSKVYMSVCDRRLLRQSWFWRSNLPAANKGTWNWLWRDL